MGRYKGGIGVNNYECSLILDVDGTLCPIKEKGQKYQDLVPYKEVVERIREYHKQGVKIILFSSRNMNSFGGNIGLINKVTARIMTEWLDKWDIPYDEIIFGKPWPGHFGFYVDDRSVRPNEFLEHSLEELDAICSEGRKRIK